MRKIIFYSSIILGVLVFGFIFSAPVSHAANKTWVATSSNSWNVASNWSPSGVPISTSNIIFSASSSVNCTINVSTTIAQITMTSTYAGTVTQGAGINVTIGASGYIQRGGTYLGSTGSFTSGGVFTMSSGTFTGSSGAMTITGATSITGAASRFTAPSGNLTLKGNFTHTSGLFTHSSGTVIFDKPSGSPALNGSTTFYNLTFNSVAAQYSFTGTTIITSVGTLKFIATGSNPFGFTTGDEIYAQGNIDVRDLATQWSSSGLVSKITINGTGTQNFMGTTTGNPYSMGFGIMNVVVNKSSGVLNLSGAITIGANWTNTAGTINPGTSTVIFSGDCTFTGSSTFYNMAYDNTLSGGNTTFNPTTSTIITVQNNLYTGGYNGLLWNGGTSEIDVAKDVIIMNTSTNGYGTGKPTIVMNGTTTQNIIATTTVTNGMGILPAVTVNKSSGALQLGGVITFGDNLTVAQGSIDPGTSTVVLIGGNLSGAISFNKLIFDATISNGAVNEYFASGTVVTVNGTTTFYSGSSAYDIYWYVNSGSAEVHLRNDLLINSLGNQGGGDTKLIFDGTSTQAVYGTSTIVAVGSLPPVTLNKAAGTLNFSGTVTLNGGFINTQGAFNAGTSTVFWASGDANGSTTFNNLIFDTSINGAAETLWIGDVSPGTILTVNGTMETRGAHPITWNTGEIDLKGSLILSNTGASGGGDASIVFNGTTTQSITGNIALAQSLLPIVIVNKTSGLVVASGTFQIGGAFFIQNGEFRIPSSTLDESIKFDGAVSVSSTAAFTDYAAGSSTLILSSNFVNEGIVSLLGGAPCSTSSTIYLRSNVSGTPRSWTGAGTYNMRYVSLKDQTAVPAITVVNGVNVSNNAGSWTFTTAPTIGLVQKATVSSASTSSLPASFVSSPKPSDLVVVAVSSKSNFFTVGDNQGNTYYLAASTTLTGSPNRYLAVYYAKNVTSTGGTFTITATSSVASAVSIGIFDYVGVATSGTLDTFITNTSASGSSTLSTGNFAGSTSNELYFAATTFGASTTLTSGSGWTAEAIQADNATKAVLYTEDISTSTQLSSAATWTGATTTPYSAIGVVFLPPTSAGYPASGTLDSATFDTEVPGGAQLNSFEWVGTQPAGTSVGFQFAASNSSNGPWTYYGPSANVNAYYTANPGIPMQVDYATYKNFRYFRYRVTLLSDSGRTVTPTVNDIILNWSP